MSPKQRLPWESTQKATAPGKSSVFKSAGSAKFKLSVFEAVFAALVPLGGAAYLYFSHPVTPAPAPAPIASQPEQVFRAIPVAPPELPKLPDPPAPPPVVKEVVREIVKVVEVRQVPAAVPAPAHVDEPPADVDAGFKGLVEFNQSANLALKQFQIDENRRKEREASMDAARPRRVGTFNGGDSSRAPAAVRADDRAPAPVTSCSVKRPPASPDSSCRANYPCRMCGGCCCNTEAHLSGLKAQKGY